MSANAVLSSDARLWVLRNFDLFKSLSNEELIELAQVSNVLEFDRNKHICMSGVKHTHAYLIKEGHVRVVSTHPSGKRLTIGILKAGELIGDVDLFGNELRVGESAEAMEKTKLYAVPLDHLTKLIQSKPELTFAMTKMVGDRRSEIVNRIQDVLFLTVPQRLARLVSRLAEQFPGETKSGKRFVNMKITHAEMADLIGSNREAVSATFVKWKNDGPVDTIKGFVVIKNEALLTECSGS